MSQKIPGEGRYFVAYARADGRTRYIRRFAPLPDDPRRSLPVSQKIPGEGRYFVAYARADGRTRYIRRFVNPWDARAEASRLNAALRTNNPVLPQGQPFDYYFVLTNSICLPWIDSPTDKTGEGAADGECPALTDRSGLIGLSDRKPGQTHGFPV
ncbi:hypothetical protein [Zavarzinella formosa]|uniref:hypothetical protein n=1 Tax=Zavarzinella formosa TaxID=360055 RepID=UPI0002D6A740|nr:hypothetical protein [Zavarzinella formosa]